MIRINQIKIHNDGVKALDRDELYKALRKAAAKTLRVPEDKIANLEIIRHSIDARKKPEIYDIYLIDVKLNGLDDKKVITKCKDKNVSLSEPAEYSFSEQTLKVFSSEESFRGLAEKLSDDDKKIAVIGAGPAGLFCAYMLAENGFKPVVFERGADVDKRTEVVEHFWKTGELNTSTNVQFGEGGAGTFSDGKLNTMVKDKDGRGRAALKIFVKNGAKEDILYDAKPHIGTDILRMTSKPRPSA